MDLIHNSDAKRETEKKAVFFRRRLLCACVFFSIFLFHKGQLTLNGAACILRVKMRENAEKLHRISSTIYVGRQAPFQVIHCTRKDGPRRLLRSSRLQEIFQPR